MDPLWEKASMQLVHRDYEYLHLTLDRMERCTFILERRSSTRTSKGEEILLIAKGVIYVGIDIEIDKRFLR